MKHHFALKYFLICCLLWLPLLAVSQSDTPSPDEFVLLELEPAPLNMQEVAGMIGYPPSAKEAQIEGKVIIRVYVDEHGDYVKHTVIRDPNPMLTKAVTSKIHHLRFSPGIQKGKPIKVWVTIPFDFKLQPNASPPTKSGVFYSLEEALACPDPSSVKELYLNGQDLTAFPSAVLQFSNITVLELGDNALTRIPTSITSLTRLKFLGLQMNQLASVPADLWRMPSLVGVNLKDNAFPKSYQKSLLKSHEAKIFPKDDKGKVVW